MGGPAASVLLHDVLDESQVGTLQTWLGESAEFYGGADRNDDLSLGWEFFLKWPTELGAELPGGPCLGGIQTYSVDPGKEHSGLAGFTPADWARYRDALGWMPACELAVRINCKRPRDHKLLGWLCAELATRFDGMVDLGGVLPLPDRREWSRFRLAGRVLSAAYDTHAAKSAQVQIVDAQFLRSWVLQQNFHMIK